MTFCMQNKCLTYQTGVGNFLKINKGVMMYRYIILLIIVFFNKSVYSRTYIQCSSITSDSDYIVLNINDTQSTIFMTNGVHRQVEIRLVKDIYLEEVNDDHYLYFSEDVDNFIEYISIPSNGINEFNNNFKVILRTNNLDTTFSCFNNLFND